VFPVESVVAKRLVEEAVVVKLFVVVALVPVAFTKVKFWRVEEPLTRRLAIVESPFTNSLPVLKVVAKRLVEDAVVANELVVVALPRTVKFEASVTAAFASMVSAADVDVANVEADDVAR
jgi:hypothetical protein